MKGTYRTAFEWAKLLLSLDPEDDPYCIRLVIHHLALRAHQFEWLLEATSSALFNYELFFMANLQLPSVALAHMHLKHGAECRELLREAIKQLPYLFCKLFKELNLGDAPASIWGILPQTNAEDLFSEIYIRQTKDLWNTPEAISLLMEVAHAVGKSEPDNIVSISDTFVNLDVARFIYLDNTPSLMALVPSELLHRIPNSDSDPLPPDAKDNIFSWPSQRDPYERERNERAMESELAGHFDPIGALRALIPGWTGDGGEEDEDAIERTGIRELMENDMDRGYGDVEAGSADSEEEDVEPQEDRSSVRRLYQFLFGPRSVPQEAEGDSMPRLEDADADGAPGANDGDGRRTADHP